MTANTETEIDVGEVPNKERGCGFLKHNKAYLRSPPRSEDGVLPPFVKFDPFIPYLEREKFRGYEHFPGISFELAVTGGHDSMDELRQVPDDTDSTFKADGSGDGFSTDPPGEVYRHIDRLSGSANGRHAGDMTAFHSHDIYQHVGKTHYETPGEFIREVRTQGLSKAIPVSENHEPPVINPGLTRVFLVHPRAIVDEDGNGTAGVIGYVYLSRVVYTESRNGQFPNWAKDYARTGHLDLVTIGDQIYNDGTRAAELDDTESFGESDQTVQIEASPAGTDEDCPYCGISNLREDRRGIYCPACGYVMSDDDADAQDGGNE